MAYPEDDLAPDEELILHRHPHWKMLLVPVLVLLLVVALAGFLAALIRNQSWANVGWIVLAVIGVTAVVSFTLAPLMRWYTTHFVLTDRRVLVRQGVLTRTGLDIPMTRINSVRFRHGLLDRMLGTGTLIIESASQEPLEFDDIPHVEQVHSLLYHEVYDADRGGADRDNADRGRGAGWDDEDGGRDRRREARSSG
ncbi:MAG: PH domain-containing protein [Actinomycetota bacterium]|nr:PH domain-containing protein [Actinomycetota bacterium]